MHRQIDWKNIKWSLAVLALGGVLFGCAGNSVGGTVTTATTTTTVTTGGLFSDVAGVNLPDTPASLQYVYLSGAGRAGDTKQVVINSVKATDQFGTISSSIDPKMFVTLTQYDSQILSTNAALAQQPSRNFGSTRLGVQSFTLTDSNGSVSFGHDNIVDNDLPIPAAIRIFPGRQVQVPLFLDPDTYITETVNVGGNDIVQARFDRSWFDTINQAIGDSVVVRSFLSDYMAFDVSSMNPGDLPSLSNASGSATRFFVSGDGFAIGNGSLQAGGAPFELILPAGQGASVVGRHSLHNIPGSTTPVYSYTTIGVDPSDVTTTDPVLAHKITNFSGQFKFHFDQGVNSLTGVVEDRGYLKNVHPFEAISIPTSLDDQRQQVVMFSETISNNGNGTKSATINNLMWGYLDLAKKQVFIYPLANVTDPDALTNRNGEIAGTLGTMYKADGSVTLSEGQMKYVQFSMPGAPSGFATSGKIVVLRR